MHSGIIAVCCCVAFITACASSTSRTPISPDGCGRSWIDEPLRDVVLDSAALSARMRASLDGTDAPDSVSLLVRQGADSTTVTVRRADALPPTTAAALERSVLDELLPAENPHGRPPFRLRLSTRDGALSLGAVQMCMPLLSNSDEVAAAMRRGAADLDGGRAIVFVTVDTSGVPVAATIRSSSGNPALDAFALEIGRIARFSPARWDGEAVRVEFGLPVEIRRPR